MKRLYMFQALLLVAGTFLGFYFGDWHTAASFAMGSVLVLLNLVLLAWAGQRLMQKKRLALSTAVIVFKYAILGVILYKILQTEWVSPLWFCAGVGTLMLASMGMALEGKGETSWQ